MVSAAGPVLFVLVAHGAVQGLGQRLAFVARRMVIEKQVGLGTSAARIDMNDDGLLRGHSLLAVFLVELVDGVGPLIEPGLLLLEDLGGGKVVSDSNPPAPIAERYLESVRLLAHLHAQALPRTVCFGSDVRHDIPAFDAGVFHAEASLLLDWFVPHVRGTACDATDRAAFIAAWDEVIAATGVLTRDPTWVLRDYHSPNIVWCDPGVPPPSPHDCVGVIDFQDALWGPAAYDVVSLGQDARVSVTQALEGNIIAAYAEARASASSLDETAFLADYAVMGAQRNTKILGIFARLNRRDGKPHYLAHMPRVSDYLTRCLAHPALAPIAAWYRDRLPEALDIRPE